MGCEYVDLKVEWSGCGFEALAPKRDFQALSAEACTEDGSSRRVIVTSSLFQEFLRDGVGGEAFVVEVVVVGV